MKPMPATDSEEEHEDITQRTNEDNRTSDGGFIVKNSPKTQSADSTIYISSSSGDEKDDSQNNLKRKRKDEKTKASKCLARGISSGGEQSSAQHLPAGPENNHGVNKEENKQVPVASTSTAAPVS